MITNMPTSSAGVAALHQRLTDEVAALPEVGGWRGRALCRAVDPNMWFPDRGGVGAGPARLICAGCPVQDMCREDSLDRAGEEGIWAGTGPKQRDAIRAARRRTVIEAM